MKFHHPPLLCLCLALSCIRQTLSSKHIQVDSINSNIKSNDKFTSLESSGPIVDVKEKHLQGIISDGSSQAIINPSDTYSNITTNNISSETNLPNTGGSTSPTDYTQSNSSDKALLYLFNINGGIFEGKICLFDSHNVSVKPIAKFTKQSDPYKVTTTQNKMFGISTGYKSFEIFDLDTRQISRGPNPPEWRQFVSVAYFKDKLYYLGGLDPETYKTTNRVDVLIDGKWQTGPAFPRSIHSVQTITCDGILYVIGGENSKKIYRLSDDEREWIEVGKLPEKRGSFGVASLNGRIYITGGWKNGGALKSCLCFDPSAPVKSRISRIADMNYARNGHSLIVANGKLYAIGGSHNSIEEYDPKTNKWQEIGKINIK